MSGNTLPLPHLPSWHALGQFNLHSWFCCEGDELKKGVGQGMLLRGRGKNCIQSFILKSSRKDISWETYGTDGKITLK
jgi:hypothetical protein